MKFFFYIFLLSLVSCHNNISSSSSREVTTAFYHWKSHIAPRDMKCLPHDSPLYLRFFDVDWNGRIAVPKAIVQLEDWETEQKQALVAQHIIVPVVFITNQTMLSIKKKDISTLAIQMVEKLDEIALFLPHYSIQHFQLDCDWSLNSKANYFALIEAIAALRPHWTLSATLRLHQYKYPTQTGVPPVHHVVLMYYNMGEVDDWLEPNSILNNEVAREYLNVRGGYPLPMDVALPLFSWGVVFREGRMVKLLPLLTLSQLQDEERFLLLGENRYQVKESFYLDGVYLYKDDKIRWEMSTQRALLEAASLLQPHIQGDSIQLIYYHLDSTLLNNIGMDSLQYLSSSFLKRE